VCRIRTSPYGFIRTVRILSVPYGFYPYTSVRTQSINRQDLYEKLRGIRAYLLDYLAWVAILF